MPLIVRQSHRCNVDDRCNVVRCATGGVDPSLQAAPFQYTPLVVDLSLSIGVSGLSVGGTPVSMAASEATLDSGTAVMLVC